MATEPKYEIGTILYHEDIGMFRAEDRFWHVSSERFFYGADGQDDVFYPEDELTDLRDGDGQPVVDSNHRG